MTRLFNRREFAALVGGAAIACPAVSQAQRAERLRHIAWLGLGRADTPSLYVESLRTGLAELGWIEGRNLALSLYWATGRNDMEAVARELLASDPDIVVAQELMVLALRAVRTEKPVLFGFSGDPVQVNLVQSWARPGSNYTGRQANRTAQGMDPADAPHRYSRAAATPRRPS